MVDELTHESHLPDIRGVLDALIDARSQGLVPETLHG